MKIQFLRDGAVIDTRPVYVDPTLVSVGYAWISGICFESLDNSLKTNLHDAFHVWLLQECAISGINECYEFTRTIEIEDFDAPKGTIIGTMGYQLINDDGTPVTNDDVKFELGREF